MAFTPGQSGNMNGRPSKSEQAKRQYNNDKLKKLYRALQGVADEAILTAAGIMNSKGDGVKDADRLRAAMFLLQEFVATDNELYKRHTKSLEGDKEEDAVDEEDRPRAPVFSLTHNPK